MTYSKDLSEAKLDMNLDFAVLRICTGLRMFLA